MSLQDYERAFSNLKLNTRGGGEKSPHKVAMLLAVIDLINNGECSANRIYFNDQLKAAFSSHFNRLKTASDKDNPHLPFFHLRSSGFWHHYLKPGVRDAYNRLATASGTGVIDKNIAYVYLDDELFELLNFKTIRELLKSSLYGSLTLQRRDELLAVGDGWDWLECEAIVRDYFAMLQLELADKPYNKAEYRRNLMPSLRKRSNGAVEFKHQNISAILLELGMPYIRGYKPAFNYQGQLYHVVLSHLAGHQQIFSTLNNTAAEEVVPAITYGAMQLERDSDIPERIPSVKEPQREYIARKPNYSLQEQMNRSLGERGEEIVLEFEKARMVEAGREDLVDEVKWQSRDEGDGLGYDILSFDPGKDCELFIEVKTTKCGKYQPFFISENEVAFSRDYQSQYSLYRVYDFTQKPRFFQLDGAVDQHVRLLPKTYQAWVK